ncbi:hypothetical protein GCM10012289_50390 [Nonomuraea cavernae]|uniref:Uncharacterized protein n=1 Tax=Nonomuraea cavernae TaxID=2045107 RepID=A0A917Z4V5_9ACTN|nr:hypothetical protein GCM10012289_50390 [Nonomuraea cavernae]
MCTCRWTNESLDDMERRLPVCCGVRSDSSGRHRHLARRTGGVPDPAGAGVPDIVIFTESDERDTLCVRKAMRDTGIRWATVRSR